MQYATTYYILIQTDYGYYEDHYETEKVLIYSLLKDGTLSTDSDSIKLEKLSIYELAYILDILENNLFHIDNEDDEQSTNIFGMA